MTKHPLALAEQGSFFVGGTVIQADGAYSTEKPMSHAGQTFHGDHAYVSYQIPVNARRLPLVFLHGAGQSGKTWESTPDERAPYRHNRHPAQQNPPHRRGERRNRDPPL